MATGPGAAGSAATEPEEAGSAATEPEKAGSAATEPEKAGSAATEPEKAGSAATEPEKAGSAATEPEKAGSAAVEPGTLGNPVKLTDPKMMRALAHPARIAIWMHIGLRGSATATECAEVAGLSPSACSYHLRTLARYGFVEEDRASAADGRERPWRARLLAFTLEHRLDESPAGRVAHRLLAENIRAAAEEIRVRYEDRKSEYPDDWQAASGELYSVAHVTPEELEQLRARVLEVLTPYVRLDPAERSPGALPVRVMLDLFPWFGPEEAR
jgi:DNA-binding MarR family transcriptional regulator